MDLTGDQRSEMLVCFPEGDPAQVVFERLYRECLDVEKRSKTVDCEVLSTATMMLIADVVRLEMLERRLQSDIAARGVGGERRNGRQTYWQENKSVALLAKAMDQKRKLLECLKLVKRDPDQPKMNEDVDDEFDEL